MFDALQFLTPLHNVLVLVIYRRIGSPLRQGDPTPAVDAPTPFSQFINYHFEFYFGDATRNIPVLVRPTYVDVPWGGPLWIGTWHMLER